MARPWLFIITALFLAPPCGEAAVRARTELCESILVDIVPMTRAVRAQHIEFHLQTLREIHLLLSGSPLRVPPRLELRIWDPESHAEPEARPSTPANIDRYYIVTHGAGTGVNPSTLGNYDPMFAHEVGHRIFTENMRDRFRSHPVINELGNHFHRIVHQSHGDPLLTRRINRIRSVVNWESFALDPRVLPYSELFADLVAVVHAGDGSAISRTLSVIYPAENPIPSGLESPRDFLARIPLEGWSERNPHRYFGPTRSFIGRVLLPRIESNAQKGQLLNRVLGVICDELALMGANWVESERFEMDPETANRRLIERLER